MFEGSLGFFTLARANLDQAYSRVAEYYKAQGDDGLMDKIRFELKKSADHVRELAERDQVFHRQESP